MQELQHGNASSIRFVTLRISRGWSEVARKVERANTIAAHGIGRNIESLSEGEGLRAVQDFMQRPMLETTHRLMEEAWANRSVGFDDGRHPGRIAARRDRLDLAQLSAKMHDNSSQFFWASNYKTAPNFICALPDERFHLAR